MSLELVVTGLLVLLVALLYSSVGHGGATGYLAVMALMGYPLKDVAVVALTMNVLVAGVAFYHFAKAGRFIPKLALPFLITSLPAAFMGGFWQLSDRTLSLLLAAALTYAAVLLLLKLRKSEAERAKQIPRFIAPAIGLGVGFLSGVIGIGGGVFLSPLVVLFNWATVAQAAGLSSCFIVANSLSGLAARGLAGTLAFSAVFAYAPVALFGGIIGSRLGARRFDSRQLRLLLAVVLLVAAIKSALGG